MSGAAQTPEPSAGQAPAQLFGGKVAVITGASAGIGEGFARHAASLGMRLVLADIAEERLARLADELRGGGAEVEAVFTDVAEAASVEALAERAYARFGTVDLLLNNAGIMAMGYSWEITAEQWDRALRINVGGYVNGIRAFVPRLLAQGGRAWVVNVSSVGGFLPSPLMAPYSVTKFGTLALSESLAYELQLKRSQIQVSVVLPDSVRSEIFKTAAAPDSQTPPEVAGLNAQLQARADTEGISAEEHARRCFEQIAAGRYWVFPQPDMIDGALRGRTDMILGRRDPTLGPQH
ncbi:SDR family NAD(P)-dependent oxidoreductase [Streptomyces sp. ODS28]|uniref:SDR family NAD(P)-dependent oxidoreductase n=1 Tax=Streptomyces sp. ODS28 TaxID=3136688 RepID=UPI0031F19C28